MKNESEYRDGYREGVQKDLFRDGRVSYIYELKLSRYHGEEKEWYESGQLKLHAIWELGHLISKKSWNELGQLTEEYNIADHPDKVQELAKTKSRLGQV